jgi:coenzyme F420-reducing hydrogenase gamma subunit
MELENREVDYYCPECGADTAPVDGVIVCLECGEHRKENGRYVMEMEAYVHYDSDKEFKRDMAKLINTDVKIVCSDGTEIELSKAFILKGGRKFSQIFEQIEI